MGNGGEDQKLLAFYLALGGPDAGPWNLSPQSAYLEYKLRAWLEVYLTPFAGIEVCNIGIGVGLWDDVLGYRLCGHGRLTSIDIDPEICQILRYRQQREGHPNPARVLCLDILSEDLPPDRFDFVTIIGSTVYETGNYERALLQAARLLKVGGLLFYSDFSDKSHSQNPRAGFESGSTHAPERFRACSGSLGVDVLAYEEDSRFLDMPFYLFLGRRR